MNSVLGFVLIHTGQRHRLSLLAMMITFGRQQPPLLQQQQQYIFLLRVQMRRLFLWPSLFARSRTTMVMLQPHALSLENTMTAWSFLLRPQVQPVVVSWLAFLPA